MADRAELVITALQQRIGELVSGYETQVAILRAEITELLNEAEQKKNAQKEYEDHLNNLTNQETQ